METEKFVQYISDKYCYDNRESDFSKQSSRDIKKSISVILNEISEYTETKIFRELKQEGNYGWYNTVLANELLTRSTEETKLGILLEVSEYTTACDYGNVKMHFSGHFDL